jgi:hypothetical protein
MPDDLDELLDEIDRRIEPSIDNLVRQDPGLRRRLEEAEQAQPRFTRRSKPAKPPKRPRDATLIKRAKAAGVDVIIGADGSVTYRCTGQPAEPEQPTTPPREIIL